jgi:hypothetical protein
VTHADKVLRLLSDGEPHSHMEGYRLGVMLHSRVADLRKRGYEIKCWHENGLYLYQLFGTVGTVQTPGETAATAAASGPPASRPSPPERSLAPDAAVGPTGAGPDPISPPGSAPVQLSVWEAAA